MRKMRILVAIALVMFIAGIASVAHAYGDICVICGSSYTSTYQRVETWSPSKNGEKCWEKETTTEVTCHDCGFKHTDISSDTGPYHTFGDWTDGGCSDGWHYWFKDCVRCGRREHFWVHCPGPPFCVMP